MHRKIRTPMLLVNGKLSDNIYDRLGDPMPKIQNGNNNQPLTPSPPPTPTMPAGPQFDGLRELYTCSICLDLFTQTTVTPCMHRFSKKCITSAWKKRDKACPLCQQKVTALRHLKPDTAFDESIRLLFPNRDEIEYHEEIQLTEVCSTNVYPNVPKGHRPKVPWRDLSKR